MTHNQHLPLYVQPRVITAQTLLDFDVSQLCSSVTVPCRHRPCNSRAAVKAVNQPMCADDNPHSPPPHPKQPTPPHPIPPHLTPTQPHPTKWQVSRLPDTPLECLSSSHRPTNDHDQLLDSKLLCHQPVLGLHIVLNSDLHDNYTLHKRTKGTCMGSPR